MDVAFFFFTTPHDDVGSASIGRKFLGRNLKHLIDQVDQLCLINLYPADMLDKTCRCNTIMTYFPFSMSKRRYEDVVCQLGNCMYLILKQLYNY